MRFQTERTDNRTEIVFDDGGMNLLSRDALRELRAIVDALRSQCGYELASNASTPADGLKSAAMLEGAGALVLRSGRGHIFAAGADMAEMRDFSWADANSFAREGQELFAAIEKLPMITAVVIDGDCFGGALDLAMAFDVRLSTPRSRFSHPGSRLGIVTGFGGTSRWRKIVGRPAASALMIGNRVLTAGEALALGLVDHVAEDHGPDLERLAGVDARTVQFVKELTSVSPRLSRSQLLLMARRLGQIYWPQ